MEYSATKAGKLYGLVLKNKHFKGPANLNRGFADKSKWLQTIIHTGWFLIFI